MARLWFINQYATTPETGIGGRHHHLADALGRMGHDVVVVAARRHHLVRDAVAAEAAPQIEKRAHHRLVRLAVPRYPHAHHPGRILAWLAFGAQLPRLPRLLGTTPDAVLYSSPSLLGYPGARRLARRSGARLVFEVRDIWPLTLVEVGGKSASHPLIRHMQRIEDRAYAEADAVVSNLPNAVEHMAERGMDRSKFSWIGNGFSAHETERLVPLPADLAAQFPADGFVVGYAGTIGTANALYVLLDAAKRLKGRPDIRFVIVGNGRERDALMRDARARGLDRVTFVSGVPKAMVPAVLERFDACYIGLTAVSLFRFGVSPNKLFDYLAAARPVLFGVNAGPYRPVEAAGAGFQVPPEDPGMLAEAIERMAALSPEERLSMGERGRRYALEHHEYGILAKRLESVLLLPPPQNRAAP